MNRKRITIITGSILIIVLAGFVVWQRRAPDHVHAEDAQLAIYYCPMHPTVTSGKPGSCPICGMKLVRRTGSKSADVAAQMAQSEPGGSSAAVSLSPAQRVMANVRTVTVTPTATTSDFVTTGRVALDERRLAQVTSYTAGRIEQLFVNFTGDTVVRGRAVATIYSPDLFATQQEYLLALRNRERMQRSGFAQARSAADDLAESSRRKLSLFGMTNSQIERLATEGRPFYTTTIVAPVSGIVTRKDVVPQQYVMQGQPLFEIADLSTVWVEADVYEKDLALVQPGQRVSVLSPSFPGVELSARVSFIQPVLEGESRTNRVRIELPNRGLRLKPQMYVTVRFFSESAIEQLMVPAGAVVDRGLEQFVWVEVSPGSYTPRRVQVGKRTTDRVEIVSGLQAGESIVAEGAFLLDSESQLRSAGANHGSHGS